MPEHDDGLMERVQRKVQVLDKDPETPECEKMAKARERGSQAIGEFLEWLQGEGYQIGEWGDEEMYPVHKSPEQWIADFFGIDLAKVEQECRLILARLEVVRAQKGEGE